MIFLGETQIILSCLVHVVGACFLCMLVWISFEPVGQSVKFEKKVKISKLLSFFNFCDNRHVSLQAPEKNNKRAF